MESWVGIAYAATIYISSVLSSAAVILLFHNFYPKEGATVGASGGVFGLLAAALIMSHRRSVGSIDRESRLRIWLWIAFLAGLSISFLPGISMAGHVGGSLPPVDRLDFRSVIESPPVGFHGLAQSFGEM